MFNLFHPRGENSYFKSDEAKSKLFGGLERTHAMSKLELGAEISIWKRSWKYSFTQTFQFWTGIICAD